MDAIEPILPNPSILPEVRAATRSERVNRDGHQGGGYGQQRRRRDDEDAVEVDVDGVDASEDSDDDLPLLLQAPAHHLIDLTADGVSEPPARRVVDVIDDDEAEAPTRRIDLSA